MDQKTALEALEMGYNIFLTGPAGSGKTFVLNKFIGYLSKNRIPVAVTASTGIAATHLGGTTIHSWSGIGIKDRFEEKDFKRLAKNTRFQKRIKVAKVLVIDEISMMHAYQLEMVDSVCRRFRELFLPFGGIQIVFCGDFFQLPPVRKGNVRSSFAFESRAWKEAGVKVCYLDEQHRQRDDELTGILNGIRNGELEEEHCRFLESRLDARLESAMAPTRLYTHNWDIDRVNHRELEKLDSKPRRYLMGSEGNKKLVNFLKDGCLAPESLILKEGALVMFVKNNFEQGYVNGTRGVVIGFDKDNGMPIVRTNEGKVIKVRPEVWSLEENDKIVASIKQVPLRLAWAITVHKSQGMSLDAVEVDLGKSFEFGMGYVALSRSRTLSGMSIIGINEAALCVDPEVLSLDAEMKMDSKSFENELFEKKKIKNDLA